MILELPCPVCGDPVPQRGYLWRRVPWLSGKPRMVHPACAPSVDAQERLSEPDGRLLGVKPTIRRRRP